MAEKVDPFRRESDRTESVKERSALDGEITIRLNARKVLRGSLLVLMLVVVFYVGRLSAGPAPEAPSFDFSGLTDLFSSDDASPSGLAVSEVNETKEESAPVETALEEPETATENESTESEPEGPETFVTSYTGVALSLDEAYIDWKETWGKITGISYTIKNNEAGSIKPHHFVMLIEGYDDIEKKFDVAYTSQKVKAGETLKDESAVSGGFAYSPKQIPDGDLTKVKVSLFLYDASDKLIASHHRDVNLQGN